MLGHSYMVAYPICDYRTEFIKTPLTLKKKFHILLEMEINVAMWNNN